MEKLKNPEWFKKRINNKPKIREILIKNVPYWKTLSLELEAVGDGEARFVGTYKPELSQMNILHGGVLASLIDSSCACAAYSTVHPEGYITTIDLQVNYLNPVKGGTIGAYAHCIKSGKTICFCEAAVYNEKNEIVCSGSSQLLKIIER